MSMSTGNPPKGSADWLAEQQGEETTPPVKGTQAWADAAPEPEPAPKGTQEWVEQNTPEPTESKPTPQTDVAPKADKQVGVSPQNNADAVMGYDTQIATLQDLANKSKPETEEERKKRERKEKSKKIIAAVGDGLMALSNLYFTTKGAPNMYNHQTMSQQTPLQKRLEEAKKEREANADKYLQYSLKIGDLQNDKAKTLREMEAQQEARKLAREKAQREQEQHGWLAALQPDKLREQAGKATTAEEKAKTAKAEAENAPEYYKAKVATEKTAAGAHKASATASYAKAAKDKAESGQGFPWWDEKGNMHLAKTEREAEVRQTQNHNPIMDVTDDVEDTNHTEPLVYLGQINGEKKTNTHKTKVAHVPMKPDGKRSTGVIWK